MKITGGCYCGEVRYEFDGDPIFKAQCHCRECQSYTGGHPNVIMGAPEVQFKYTKGEPKKFTRSDLENPVTREFCGNCGTPLVSRSPAAPGVAIVKVGTMDDPSLFGKPDIAIFTCDAQSFHTIPEGIPAFEKAPG